MSKNRLRIVILTIILLVFSIQTTYAKNQVLTHKDNLYYSYLTLLYPYITKELENNGLGDRSFELYDAKIVNIKREDQTFTFHVTVQVNTYEGAHNPPYGLETISFKVSPNGVYPISFKHSDKKDNN
jgi:hypothetical protein